MCGLISRSSICFHWSMSLLFCEKQKRRDPEEKGGMEGMEGVEGRETRIKIYCEKRLFLKKHPKIKH